MKRTLLLAACALLLGSSSPTLTTRQRAVHALDRLAFGPRPGDVDRVLQLGVDRWIDEQLHPERIADAATDARVASYETLSMSSRDIFDKFYKPIVDARRAKKNNVEEVMRDIPRGQRPRRVIAELSAQRLVRATSSERQLNEVMVDFWMNHFNVFAPKGLNRVLVTSYERDVIRPHIWGRFEDLLMATAKSPAMLFYLDNARSRGGALNENYAREIMELHTLGVDGGYTQQDVTELARVLTGWTIAREGQGFVFLPAFHDRGTKSVLGTPIGAGGGVEEGEAMVRLLARHPATAHRIAYKLCQRFIADEPPASAVDRVAQTFLATRGDLRRTVKAVIDSPEFRDPKYFRGKVKTPFEYAVSAVRAVGGELTDPLPLARQLQQMGEGLYLSQPPTGYSDTAQAWVSTAGLMARLNFALDLASNKVPGVRVDVTSFVDTALSGGELSAATRKTINDQHADVPTIAGLILGSPEFQRQ
jgi:uncharacterized protein (DUF1800 family)